MLPKTLYVGFFALLVALLGFLALAAGIDIGPVVVTLAFIPLSGILLARRSLLLAIPDLVFGAIDTGLLAIPALLGGVLFGALGAVAGGVIGDALTDAIAGFLEGEIAEWLRRRGIEASRDAITTALGKMAGCLLGGGLVMTAAMLLGVEVKM